MMSTWLVTGAGRGLGSEIARCALDRGNQVAATARHPGQIAAALAGQAGVEDRLLPIELDVTDEDQVTRAVDAATRRFGGIDVVVNNAGGGLIGAVEETSSAEVRQMFEINVFGTLNVIRAVLPGMRAKRSGHVVNIGSMGGFAQVAGWGVYGATKFALEGITEAMSAELAPLGVKVTIVEPGSFRTGFLSAASIRMSAKDLPDYDGTVGRVRRSAALGGRQPGDPAKAAAAIYAAVTSPHPPLRLPVGPDAVAFVEAKLSRVRDELDSWRELSVATQFDDVPPPAPTSGSS